MWSKWYNSLGVALNGFVIVLCLKVFIALFLPMSSCILRGGSLLLGFVSIKALRLMIEFAPRVPVLCFDIVVILAIGFHK